MKQETATGQAWLKWLGGAAVGAVTMYLSDPDRGKRRRALTRDKIYSVTNRAGDVLDVASRDIGNRLQGLRAQARHMLQRTEPVDDPVLVERVRARIGRAISHPHPIHVIAQQGRIALSGPVLVHERMPLLNAVKGVEGVVDVEDHLEPHESAQGMPSLQGEGKARSSRQGALQRNWPPGLRAAAMLGGGALGLYGLSRRAPSGVLLGAVGLSLMARGISNQPFARLRTMATSPQTIELEKSIHIEAPQETVFDLWSRYENFPHFMSNVIDVQNRGNGRSHWIVSGPAGTRIEWDATLTESARPHVLAWKTEPDATIDHAGTVRFDPTMGSGTRVTVHMIYSPPAGALGHAFASLFQGNPERQMEEDLLRMKSFIESSSPPHGAAQPLQPGQVLH